MARSKARNARLAITIDGEKELNAQIKRINAEFKKMEAEMKLVKAEFAGQLNTERALTAQLAVLERQYANTGKQLRLLEEKQKALKNTIQETEQEIRELTVSLDAAPNAEAYEQTTLRIGQLRKELEYLYRRLATNETQTLKAKIRQGELNAEIRDTGNYLDEARRSYDKTAKSIDQYGERVGEADEKLETLASYESFDRLQEGAEKLRDIMRECVDAAQAFDLSVKGVVKTVDGIPEDKLREMLLDLSTEKKIPVDVNTLATIAQGGGQYGVSQGGLEDYIRTIANLSVSTDITSDTGAQNLARFVSLMQVSEEYFENVGSTITALGNTTRTTESQILDMATGIASAGNLAGMSAADVMALSAALSSAGMESEAGSSAMSTFIINIANAVAEGGQEVEHFAQMTGRSAEEFVRAWETDALGTIVSVIDGLSEMEKAGGNVFAALEDLGVADIRMRRAVLGLATSEGTLEQSLLTANSAWDENIALVAEASKYYEADANKKQIMLNQLERLKISVGESVNPALNTFYELIGRGAEGLAQLNEEMPGLMQILSAVGTGITLFTGATIAVKTLGKAIEDLKFKGGGWVALATTAATVLATLIMNAENASVSVEKLTEGVDGLAEAQKDADTETEHSARIAEVYLGRIEALEAQYGDTAGAQDEYKAAVMGLSSAMPQMNLEIDEQTGLLKDNTEAIRENMDAWVEAEREKHKQTRMSGLLNELFTQEAEYQKALAEMIEAQAAYEAAQAAFNGGNMQDLLIPKTAYEQAAANVEAYRAAMEYTTGILEDEFGYSYTPVTDTGTAPTAPAQSYTAGAADPYVTQMEEAYAATQIFRDAFAEAFADVRAELESTFTAFEEFDTKAGISLRDLTNNLEDNAEAMRTYTENLHAALEDDRLSDGFKTWIKNQSPESVYGLLEELRGATDEELSELSKAWDGYESTLDETAGDVAVTTGEVAEIVHQGMQDADQSAVAYVSGSLTVQGLISGLRSQKRRLQEEADEISAIFSKAYRKANQLASPSKLFRKYGRNDIEGLILGHEDMRKKLEESSLELAGVMAGSFELATARMNASLNFTNNFRGYDYTAILNKIYRSMGNMGGGTAAGLPKISASAKRSYENQLMTRLLY